ncbi:steroid 21-hydroxylase [Tachyglossus aculeatus]|uniref:steroid 21-hydroxylase n=1 Tax=Tachyglossus aculeatus TaxID=9261 RepID=UPI0018F4A8F2|nr:steroid 21-hydroxylase [Tachyglossus aculeatus]
MLLLALLLLGALAALWVWGAPLFHRSKLHLPPRVPGFLHQLRPNLPIHLLHLAHTHGPLYRIHFGNQDVVILNSRQLIWEAMVKNWLNFAGRPLMKSSQLVSMGGKDLSLGNYSPAWKDLKKLTVSALQLEMRNKMEPMVWRLAHEQFEGFRAQAGSTVDLFREFSKLTNRIICTITFGDLEESTLQDVQDCTSELVSLWASSSIRILDIFPFLRFIPYPALRRMKTLLKKRDRFIREQMRRHRETQVSGVVRDMTDYMLRELREKSGAWDVSEEHMHMALLDLVIGGTGTTAAVLNWVVLFLLHYPEVQKRLQDELDLELGPASSASSASLLPYKDRARLPLLNATITEVLRLRPVVALGLPHLTLRDTSLGGFDIPRNTIVIPNLYGAHHDAAVWEQPFAFRPDRFLKAESSQLPLPFGCGARICVGEGLARVEIFLILVQLLQRFTLSPAPASAAALPSLTPDFGGVTKSQPFRVHLLPRGGGGRAAT